MERETFYSQISETYTFYFDWSEALFQAWSESRGKLHRSGSFPGTWKQGF